MKIEITTLLLFALLVTSCKKDSQPIDCPTGYTGNDCKTEKEPLFVNLSRLILKKYPAKNNGMSWDDFSTYADPYFKIEQIVGSTLVEVYRSEHQDEVPPSIGAIWNIQNLKLSPGQIYTITFFDYDSNGVDSLILTADIFNIYQKDKGFPTQITVEDVELTVNYTF